MAATFKKSKRCDTGSCVEVAIEPDEDVVHIRNTEVPGQVVTFTKADWKDLLAKIRAGGLDAA